MGGERRFEHDEEFKEFAAGFLPTLLRGAFLLLQDVDLAEDAVQGTMLRVFRHWHEARIAPEAYSRTTLVNICRDHWRRLARHPLEEISPEDEDASTDEMSPFTRDLEERQAMVQALGELPERQREVLVLRFFLDLSVAETAELLELPEGTVKSAASRGLEHLRGLLEPPTEEATAC